MMDMHVRLGKRFHTLTLMKRDGSCQIQYVLLDKDLLGAGILKI